MRALALLISFCIGFLSLSQEIVWIRIVSFAMSGLPHAFSVVLVAFLVGIAIGSIAGRGVCERSRDVPRAAAWALLIAAGVDFGCLYGASAVVSEAPTGLRLPIILLMIALTAGSKGVLFPIVHHLGSRSDAGRVGRSVSRVYLGNVIGSTLGPIVTGFWLLDHIGAERAFAMIGIATAGLGTIALARSGGVSSWRWTFGLPVVVLAVGSMALLGPPPIIEALARWSLPDTGVTYLAQNKHGVIHVKAEDQPSHGDVTYGGNAYDGRVNVDMQVNSNEIDRAYLMAVLHPNPRRVLVIGLSSGAWTRVIAGFPGIEHIDVVEINPGYRDLVKRYPDIAPVLTDPRVQLHLDDGRRWLRLRPQVKYDLIFQNTTFHWRAYTTGLLSREYFSQVKTHLSPGGIFAANTTNSADVYATAATVFEHAVRYKSFAYMSDRPLVKRRDAVDVLRACRVGSHPAFDEALLARERIGGQLAHDPLESATDFLSRSQLPEPPQVISDLNLVTEYRHGRIPSIPGLRLVLPIGVSPDGK